ncbi:MAG: alpha/beta hydrolase [Thermoguttaceae bacterium]|nr:alpha/beta hydrolase [Thermoguttaceae bacterium]
MTDRPEFARISYCLALVALLVMVAASGCATIIGRPRYNNADLKFQLDKPSGPTLSQSVSQTLKAYDVKDKLSFEQLDELERKLRENPSPELVYAYVETSYLVARRSEKSSPARAQELYLASALHAYHYLFNPVFEKNRDQSVFNAKILDVVLVYNGACERFLKLALQEEDKVGKPFPFKNRSIYAASNDSYAQALQSVYLEGAWRPEEYASFIVASDCQYAALNFDCKRSGLGAPLVATRQSASERPRPEEEYYPKRVCFPATALIKPNPAKPLGLIPAIDPNARVKDERDLNVDAYLEIYDSLYTPNIVVNGQSIPLETDYTTPLAYYLESTEKTFMENGWRGLVSPDEFLEVAPVAETERERALQGLYMFEPYDPNKIPVVMTHGLGSSPITWIEMYNALRNASNIQSAYQFMFFFYPTGQPFWISAATMREELRRFRETVDPDHDAYALDHIILIGHSMGGLVSRMQVLESGDHIWNRISSEPIDALDIDDETREDWREWFFFKPNPSVKCVITIATPFEGSEFANSFTQWLADHSIRFPKKITRALENLITNPENGKIRDPRILQTTTSVEALSPNSPIFDALDECEIPDDVALYNIIGVLPSLEKRWIKPIKSDGVVNADSASRDDVDAQFETPAAHTAVHMHPKTILEVKDLLARRLIISYAEIAREKAQNEKKNVGRGYLPTRETRLPATFPLPVEFGTITDDESL